MECYQNVNIFNENIYGLHWLVRFNKTAPEMEKKQNAIKMSIFLTKISMDCIGWNVLPKHEARDQSR